MQIVSVCGALAGSRELYSDGIKIQQICTLWPAF